MTRSNSRISFLSPSAFSASEKDRHVRTCSFIALEKKPKETPGNRSKSEKKIQTSVSIPLQALEPHVDSHIKISQLAAGHNFPTVDAV